ncbi:MAG: acetylglutamate kinase [Alphaproteobacteria bacterium]|nr:acetylglutamate kinase [Alphaproteobacteria bacterium]
MSVVNIEDKIETPEKISFLNELIPNIKRYYGETIVIYYDGDALYNDELAAKFAEDIVLMKNFGINVIIVHGGDKLVEKTYKKYNLTSSHINGVRIIDQDAIEVAEMVLSGLVNKKIVTSINNSGGIAIGISGKDANLIEAKKYRSSKQNPNSNIESIIDFGFTGEPTLVNPDVLFAFEDTDFIPVIAPLAIGDNNETFHINPLTAASIVVSSLAVRKFVIITDHKGIPDSKNSVASIMNYKDLNTLYRNGSYSKDMEHIVNTCMCTLENKIDTIHVIDGKVPHSLLLNIFTDEEYGTLIKNEIY